ncbi:MAG: hypothetical protein V1697_02850 [Candidatus Levyibacteriota bacterium]
MRKIISKKEEAKKKRMSQVIVGVVLIFIMFFSVLGYSFSGGNESVKKIEYNGFEFIEQNSFWILEIEGMSFIFKNNPQQVEKIDGELNDLDSYYNQPLYISSNNPEAELEIYRNLFYQNQIVQRMQSACLESEECEEDIPTKNCDENFIIIKESNESGIMQDRNCVFIKGKQENLTQITDEFLFKILGVEE